MLVSFFVEIVLKLFKVIIVFLLLGKNFIIGVLFLIIVGLLLYLLIFNKCFELIELLNIVLFLRLFSLSFSLFVFSYFDLKFGLIFFLYLSSDLFIRFLINLLFE